MAFGHSVTVDDPARKCLVHVDVHIIKCEIISEKVDPLNSAIALHNTSKYIFLRQYNVRHVDGGYP